MVAKRAYEHLVTINPTLHARSRLRGPNVRCSGWSTNSKLQPRTRGQVVPPPQQLQGPNFGASALKIGVFQAFWPAQAAADLPFGGAWAIDIAIGGTVRHSLAKRRFIPKPFIEISASLVPAKLRPKTPSSLRFLTKAREMDRSNPDRTKETPVWGLYQRENFWKSNEGQVPPFDTDPGKLEELAEKKLTQNGWYYASSNAGLSYTHTANRQAFYRHRIIPRMLVDTNNRDMDTMLFGHKVPAPIGFSPIGINKIYNPLGELPSRKWRASSAFRMR